MLLDRLFKFIESEDQLNEVLAGYFEKLVISLRKRKEQQFIKYIFGEKNENLDKLVEHVYNNSIAEVLKNMLSVTASNFDPDFQQVIKEKKTSLMFQLIDRLTSEYPYHTNLAASMIIMDLMDDRESRELFITLDEKNNLAKVCQAALNPDADQYQRTTAWSVLNKACKLVSQSEKPKSNDRDLNDSGDSDDIIVKHDSDDENKDTDTGSAETPLSAAFWNLLEPMSDFLKVTAER